MKKTIAHLIVGIVFFINVILAQWADAQTSQIKFGTYILPFLGYGTYFQTHVVFKVGESTLADGTKQDILDVLDYTNDGKVAQVLSDVKNAGIDFIILDLTNDAQWQDKSLMGMNGNSTPVKIIKEAQRIGLKIAFHIAADAGAPPAGLRDAHANRANFIWDNYAQLPNVFRFGPDNKPLLVLFDVWESELNKRPLTPVLNHVLDKFYLASSVKGGVNLNQGDWGINQGYWGYRNMGVDAVNEVRFVSPNTSEWYEVWHRASAWEWSKRVTWATKAGKVAIIGSYDDSLDGLFWGINTVVPTVSLGNNTFGFDQGDKDYRINASTGLPYAPHIFYDTVKNTIWNYKNGNTPPPTGNVVDRMADKTISLLSQANFSYACADSAGQSSIIADRPEAAGWESFKVIKVSESEISLRAVVNNKLVCAESCGAQPLIANRDFIGSWETFTVVDLGNNDIALISKANNQYVSVDSAGSLLLSANSATLGAWQKFTFAEPATPTEAYPFVHKMFSSHMVLQRDVADPIWGWTTPNAVVTVTINGNTYTATAAEDGFWLTKVGPFPAGGPYTINITGPQTVTLTDVLMGDVFLFAGENNIWDSLTFCPVLNVAAEIADSANYPNIRYFNVDSNSENGPSKNLATGAWVAASPSTTGGFSATAYFTARELYKQQNVPIGIVTAARRGTNITGWVNPTFAASIADLTQSIYDQSLQTPGRDTISGPYNGMLEPLTGLSMKGVVWYQGESNASSQEQYGRLLPGMMANWRTLFGYPTLPFVIIQLPNYMAPTTAPVQSGWAELRESQLNTVLNDARSRIVTTIDIGDASTMNPRDKQDVGLRASWAISNLVYGKNVVNQGPIFTGATVSGTNVTCTFSSVGAGLMVGTKTQLLPAQPVVGGTLTGFAVSGTNKVFYAANAIISGSNKVVVSSTSVSAPVAVRYGWANNPSCNLYNKITDAGGAVIDGLPASPFRNDPVYRLSVNSGTGSTTTSTLGVQLPIVANTYVGEVFHHWSGDTSVLSGTTSASATVTMSQPYVTVLANYTITGAPANFRATAASGSVSLSWDALNGAHYMVQRATLANGPFSGIANDIVGNTWVDNTGTIGTTYYYRVTGFNPLGGGPASPTVSATP